MNKRVLSLLMVVAILAAVLGCSAFAEGAAEDLGTIVVTTAGSGEPYSLLHDDGSWTGIDSEMPLTPSGACSTPVVLTSPQTAGP